MIRNTPDDETAGQGDSRAVTPWRYRLATIWTGLVFVGTAWSFVGIILGVFQPGLVDTVNELFEIVSVPAGHTFFSAVYLGVVAAALRRGKRLALLWSFWFFGVAGVLASLGQIGFDLRVSGGRPGVRLEDFTTSGQLWNLVLLAVSVVIAVLIWLARPCFPTHFARGAMGQALVIFVGGVLAATVTTIALTQAFPGSLDGQREKVVWSIRAGFGLSHELPTSGHDGTSWVGYIAGVISALSAFIALAVFLRSARKESLLTQQDELDLRRLLLEHGGRDSLGYFATRRDKSIIWSPDRDAAIAYRVVAGVSLASGDPIGSPHTHPAVIRAWLDESREFGWAPGVLSATDEGAKAYVAAGMRAISMGDEAVVEVAAFSLKGATMAPVRQAVRRTERAGYRAEILKHRDLSQAQMSEVIKRAEDWRGNQTERGFSMALGRLGDPADGECTIVMAYDADDRLQGVLSFVPWGRNGISLDLMRRDPKSVNGLMEFMVTSLIHGCPDHGIQRVSLNFAMFREVFSDAARVGAGPIVRATNRALVFASRFWQIQSLYQSNEKYLPRWSPRHMCYGRTNSLTQLLVASGLAEGFLPGQPAPERVDPATSAAASSLGVLTAGEFTDRVRAEEFAHADVRPSACRHTDQERVRRAKAAQLHAWGMDPYPVSVSRTTTPAAIAEAHGGLAAGSCTGEQVSVTGRVLVMRDHGGLCFAVIREGEAELQIMIDRSIVGDDLQSGWRRFVDVGDHVSVTGEVVNSRCGELSVLAASWQMASKCLRPLPDAIAGLRDPVLRSRRRVLDMIVNQDARERIELRSRAVRALRDELTARGFMEVETPMLQTTPGGAAARPFLTHINAYNADLSLRIAPELYLKRLCVAGFGQIFELNRSFRNEGVDGTHNPEFTSLEIYQAYADYAVMRELVRELIIGVATTVLGKPVLIRPAADDSAREEVDISSDWPVISVHDAVSRAVGRQIDGTTTAADLRDVCLARGMTPSSKASAGELVLALYEALVEPATHCPTFYVDFPRDTSPLTRVHRDDDLLAERWDLVAFGMEIGTAYSELIDPIDQRDRLTDQSLRAAAGDPDAMSLDEDFLTDLEYGMPPTGGAGVGVDRLVMMLTGSTIRQVIAFPFVRREN